MNKNMLAVALASLVVGGVAVAAYNSFQVDPAQDAQFTTATTGQPAPSIGMDAGADSAIDPNRLEYADVLSVKAVNEKQAQYATVLGTEAIRETSTTNTPREVCNDVAVQDRAPERDGNVGGTVAGALIGAAVGNQVGGGDGRKAATVAGAVAGGYIGNRVDRNHVGGKVTTRTERQCHTVTDTSQSSKVVGYNVTFRNPDGTTGTMRTSSKPGSRISLGSENAVVGYDVTYRYQGQERTVRMDERPMAERLPVVNGEVVTQTAAAAGTGSNG